MRLRPLIITLTLLLCSPVVAQNFADTVLIAGPCSNTDPACVGGKVINSNNAILNVLDSTVTLKSGLNGTAPALLEVGLSFEGIAGDLIGFVLKNNGILRADVLDGIKLEVLDIDGNVVDLVADLTVDDFQLLPGTVDQYMFIRNTVLGDYRFDKLRLQVDGVANQDEGVEIGALFHDQLDASVEALDFIGVVGCNPPTDECVTGVADTGALNSENPEDYAVLQVDSNDAELAAIDFSLPILGKAGDRIAFEIGKLGELVDLDVLGLVELELLDENGNVVDVQTDPLLLDGDVEVDENNRSIIQFQGGPGDYSAKTARLKLQGVSEKVTKLPIFNGQIQQVTQEAIKFIRPIPTLPCSGKGIKLEAEKGLTKYHWTSGDESDTIRVFEPGVVRLKAIDPVSRRSKYSLVEVKPTIIQTSLTQQNIDCSNEFGAIDLTVRGGIGEYTYDWSNGATTEDISNLPAGGYKVVVNNPATECKGSAATVIEDYSSLVAMESIVTPDCGTPNGAIDLTVSGGSGDYGYAWSNGLITEDQSAVGAGLYTVSIVDNEASEGCELVRSIIVSTTNKPIVNVQSTKPDCASSNGVIRAEAIGADPIAYNWDNGSSEPTLSNVAAGVYTLSVTDANNCAHIKQVELEHNNIISHSVTSTAPSCQTADGSIEVKLTSANVADYSILWADGHTDFSRAGIIAGNYGYTIANTVESCSHSDDFLLSNADFDVFEATQTPSKCEEASGSLSVAIPAAHSIQWNNGMSGAQIAPLFAGIYEATISDDNGCFGIQSFEVMASEILQIKTSTRASSCGNADGLIKVDVLNSIGTLTYSWSNGDDRQTIDEVSAGVYTVSVMDATSGCTGEEEVSLNDASGPILSATVSPSRCSQPTGEIVLDASPLESTSFNWSNGATTQHIQDVFGGMYTVTAVSVDYCVSSLSVEVINDNEMDITSTVIGTPCQASKGKVFLSVGIGTDSYKVAWSDGGFGLERTELAAGQYIATLTDTESNCTAKETVVIGTIDGTVPSFELFPSDCHTNNGGIEIVADNGTIEWEDGSTVSARSDLAIGNHSFTYVTDECVVVVPFEIVSKSLDDFQIETTNSACNSASGSAAVQVDGSLSDYTFLWNNGVESPTLSNIPVGIYTVEITSIATGCSTTEQAIVNPTNSAPNNITTTPATCESADGTASIEMQTNGSYVFEWSNGDSGNRIGDLKAGKYLVTIHDEAGCKSYAEAWVEDKNPLEATTSATTSECGFNTGSASVDVLNGSNDYDITWSDGFAGATNENLKGGFYQVSILDKESLCQVTETILVATINGPQLNPTIIAEECEAGNASVQLNLTGEAPFTIEWDNGQVTNRIENLAKGTYAVTVIDANSCATVESVSVGRNNGIDFEELITNTSCGAANGAITLNLPRALDQYDINWSENWSGAFVDSIAAGIYEVDVYDTVLGCYQGSIFEIEPSNPLEITANLKHTACNEANGRIDLTIEGDGPFNVVWDNGSELEDAYSLEAGFYSAIISDALGCVQSASYQILGSVPLLFTADVKDASCGKENGEINIHLENGSALSDFAWSNGATTEVISNLESGVYIVTVTDLESGCANEKTIAVSHIEGPRVSNAQVVQPSCFGVNNGSIALVTNSTVVPAWSNGETGKEIANLAQGTYIAHLFDSQTGCEVYEVFELREQSNLNGVVSTTDHLCVHPVGMGTASIDIQQAGNFSYLWSNGTTLNKAMALYPGTYQVSVIDVSGCLGVFQGEVGSVGDCTHLIGNGANTINTNNGSGNGNGNGNGSNGGNGNGNGTNSSNTNNPGGINGGISGGDNPALLFMIKQGINDGLTPNGDGMNDALIIPQILEYPSAKVSLFNRWGEEVYSASPYFNNWRGTYGTNGNLLPEGSYFYVIDLNNGINKVITGSIYIEH